jgi:hypothetical protein
VDLRADFARSPRTWPEVDAVAMSGARFAVILVVFAVFIGSYLVLGQGFQRLNTACYDERHRDDPLEPDSSGASAVGEIVLWPLFLVSYAGGEPSCRQIQDD